MVSAQRVELVDGDHAAWRRDAAAMAQRLRALEPGAWIEHIGSTAVPGLPAKPVVDLLVGVELDRVGSVARRLAAAGFDQEGGRPGHAWLSWPDRGWRSTVVHVVEAGGERWRQRIRLRDLLIADADARAEYLAVKRAAAATAHGWADYTDAKADVVARLLARR